MKKRKNFFVLFFIYLISFVLLETPVFAKKARGEARQKSCLSNMRVLNGAVEMYNMDHSSMIDTALPGRDYEDFENILIKERYLKETLFKPEYECSYGFINMTSTGTVFCKNHGTIENSINTSESNNPTLPEYDTSLEKPFSSVYLEKQRSLAKKAERENFIRNLGDHPIFMFGVFLFLVFVISTIGGYISGSKMKTNHQKDN